MKRSSISTWVYLLLVFASGAALGVFSDHIYTTKSVIAKSNAPSRDPNESKRKHIEEMRTRLKLNADQVAKLTLILDEARTQMHDVIDKYKPEMEAIHNAQVDRVKGMLTETQRAEYTKMLAEREAKRVAEKNAPPKK
jgi:hypothetical protein